VSGASGAFHTLVGENRVGVTGGVGVTGAGGSGPGGVGPGAGAEFEGGAGLSGDAALGGGSADACDVLTETGGGGPWLGVAGRALVGGDWGERDGW
jgi:hypothetical protein